MYPLEGGQNATRATLHEVECLTDGNYDWNLPDVC